MILINLNIPNTDQNISNTDSVLLTRSIPQLPTEFFNKLWYGGRLEKYKITALRLAVDTQPFSRT